MKPPFIVKMRPPVTRAIRETIHRALAVAGLDAAAVAVHPASAIIRRALATAGLAEIPQHRHGERAVGPASEAVPDGAGGDATGRRTPAFGDAPQAPGTFAAYEFGNAAGKRSYKVYLPARAPDVPPAMMVMLHGCTQNADDFAAGTQMNRLAEDHGFIVVYPEQASHANGSGCWNWFQPQDQQRDAGEPSLIAGIVRAVATRQAADPRRIFVAGLSAGAAMAVVMGETYPELFAGVGVHSGLPYASAHDVASALAAMKGRGGNTAGQTPPAAAAPPRRAVQALPAIVFHGDRDHTVQAANATRIVEQARDAHRTRNASAVLQASAHAGMTSAGRRFSRTVYTNAQGEARIESWLLHGAGHAWSGGHARGSFTDSAGPDASAEMVRFFLSQTRGATA